MAATALALLPLVVAAVGLVVDGTYRPHGDMGLFELHTRDVGRHAVLLGPYSRFGWSHPGPISYYVAAVPYRLTGSTQVSIGLAALALHAGWVVAIALVAWRRGGLRVVLLVLVAVGLLVRAVGTDDLVEPWNPWLVLLPLVLLTLLAWSTALGETWALPAAAAVASFAVQTHVGVALFVVLVTGAGVIGLLRAPGLRRALAVTAGVLAVLWAPVVLAGTSNVREMLEFFRDPPPGPSLGDGFRLAATQLQVVPRWVSGREPLEIFLGRIDLTGPAPVPLALIGFVAAAVVAWRRRSADELSLLGLGALALASVVVATAQVAGDLYPYLVRWAWVAGLVFWLAIANVAVRRAPALVLGAALVAVTAFGVADAWSLDVPTNGNAELSARLAADVRAVLDGDDTVLLEPPTSLAEASFGVALAVDLERHGIPVAVRPVNEDAFGEHRARRARAATRRLTVVVVDGFERLARRPGRLVTRVGTETPGERERLLARADALPSTLSAAERFRRLGALPRPGPEVWVFESS